MAGFRTHYDNLQVKTTASDEVIRGAYRHLSQKWHPDRNPEHREKAERAIKIINQAYAVLSDPDKRRQHDQWILERQASEERARAAAPPPPPHDRSPGSGTGVRIPARLEEVSDTAGLLTFIGLGQYITVFANNHIDVEALAELTDADLVDMGINSVGHRKKILGSVAELMEKAQAAAEEAEEAQLMAVAGESGHRCLQTVFGIGFLAGFIIGSGFFGSIGFGIVLGIVACLYMAPTIVSFYKGHPHRWAIAIGNVFFASTGVVWIILLVLALNFVNPAAAVTLGAAALLRERR